MSSQELKTTNHSGFSVVDTTTDPLATLARLCQLVTQEGRSYEDLSGQIEDAAYALCEASSIDKAVSELTGISFYLESITEKNDEQCRDLADVYLLIGQIYQYSGQYIESIQWFNRAAIVDDRYHAPYHSMAASYLHTGQIDKSIKCLEQELILAPGNYYSYLMLADLYEKEHRNDDVEKCLKSLLERDKENIQALHSLIRHYEKNDPSIDTMLLVRRLMGIHKSFSRIEMVIRSYYLCRDARYEDALNFISSWNKPGDLVTISDLVRAHIYHELHQFKRRRETLHMFRERNHGRIDVIESKLREFEALFGAIPAGNLRKLLLFSPALH